MNELLKNPIRSWNILYGFNVNSIGGLRNGKVSTKRLINGLHKMLARPLNVTVHMIMRDFATEENLKM